MLVLDCCALVEIALGTEKGKAVQGLILEGERVLSAELLRAEAVSVFRKMVLSGKIEKKEALEALENSLMLVDEFCPLEQLQTEALSESLRLQHSSYDMFYFVLARRNGATLFTTDKKLADLCFDNGVDCIMEVAL